MTLRILRVVAEWVAIVIVGVFLALNILHGIGETGWVLTAVIAVAAAVGWAATRDTAAIREAAEAADEIEEEDRLEWLEDEEPTGAEPEPAHRHHYGGPGRPCRVCGAEYPTAPEECTWDVNVYRCETDALVCGWTFGPAPLTADPDEFAAGACRHAAKEFGGEPGDYYAVAVPVPELDD